MPSATNYETLAHEYAELWASMEITKGKAKDISDTAHRIQSGKDEYQAVQSRTGVPWFVIGVIHQMEAGLRWDRHLHNGDPLTARTRLVPAGRPKTGQPPFSWMDSACDALLMKGLDHIKDWPLERICFELERYNGFGYRRFHPETLSPYLWSGTNHYTRGKYVSDGKWSSMAVSGQSGAMAILKRLSEIDDSVSLPMEDRDPADAFRKAPELPEKKPVLPTIRESRSLWTILTAGLVKIGEIVSQWLGYLPEVQTEAQKSIDPLTTLGGWLGHNIQWITSGVVLAAFAVVFVRHLNDKRSMP